MSKHPPIISVITVCKNAITEIEACLRNVIDQLPAPIEHIVIDGASTDGTQEVLVNYGEQFEHLRWISEPDSGQSQAMNKGIVLATGRLIAFLNVDDRFMPKALCKVVELTKDMKEPVFLVGELLISLNGDTPSISHKPRAKNQIQVLIPEYFRFPANPSAYFYSKTIHEWIGNYREDEHYAMDHEFLLRASGIVNFTYTNYVFGEFRLSDTCKTRINSKNALNLLKAKRHEYLKNQSRWFRVKFYFYKIIIEMYFYAKGEIFKSARFFSRLSGSVN